MHKYRIVLSHREDGWHVAVFDHLRNVQINVEVKPDKDQAVKWAGDIILLHLEDDEE